MRLTNRTEWHVGIGEDAAGNPIPDWESDRLIRAALETVSREYGGASITQQHGGWMSPEGRLITEDGITIVAYSDGPHNAAEMAVRLCRLFRQAAVIVAEFGPHGFTAGLVNHPGLTAAA